MLKKVFLYAYDQINLGDDLFIRTVANRYPHTNFYMWSEKKNIPVFYDTKNIKVVDKNSHYINALKMIRPSLAARYENWIKKRCDAVVYIGGSIFIEYPTWKNIVNWWKYQVKYYKFYVLGANFGPYQNEEYRNEMALIMQNMEDICFRDQYSYQLFKGIATVRYAPDILFSYPMPQISEKKKQIYISVINCEKKENGKYVYYQKKYEAILDQIITFFLEKEYAIKLVSFCEEEGDAEQVYKILETYENCSMENLISPLIYDGTNYKEMLNELVTSEYIIATRFHAIVLSLVAGKKVYPIIYSNKSANMLRDIHFKGKYWELYNVKEFRIEDMIQSMQNDKYEMNISEIVEKSTIHFKMLDEILSN